jgi:hypothetical protein
MRDGTNPMRWDCTTRGCFNVLRRPKIERFAACFPGRIAMSGPKATPEGRYIDATVEVNGHFVFLEMKSHRGELPLGQRLYFERLTRLSTRISVMIICGDAETMQCEALCWIYNGQLTDWQPATLDDVIRLLNSFASWAQVQVA